MIDYGKFQASLKRLEEQNQQRLALPTNTPDFLREALDESVNLRFKLCYECLRKALRQYLHELHEELGLTDTPASPKPVFRLASEQRLLASPIENWLAYADARIATSHDYDGTKAAACLALIPDFVDDAIGIYQTMTGTTWD